MYCHNLITTKYQNKNIFLTLLLSTKLIGRHSVSDNCSPENQVIPHNNPPTLSQLIKSDWSLGSEISIHLLALNQILDRVHVGIQ